MWDDFVIDGDKASALHNISPLKDHTYEHKPVDAWGFGRTPKYPPQSQDAFIWLQHFQ